MTLEIDCDKDFFQLEIVNERLRGSISQIVKAVNALSSQMVALSDRVSQGEEVEKEVQSSLEDIRKDLSEVNSGEISLLRDRVEETIKEIRTDKGRLEDLSFKHGSLDERLCRQEARVFPDVSKIDAKIDNLDGIIQSSRQMQSTTDSAVTTIIQKSNELTSTIKKTQNELEQNTNMVGNILNMFSIKSDVFPDIFDTISKTEPTKAVEYLLSTPLFEFLLGKHITIENNLKTTRENIGSEITNLTTSVGNSVLQLNQKLVEKLDKSVFESYTTTLSKQLVLIEEHEAAIYLINDSLEHKVELQRFDDEIHRLDITKADKGELLLYIQRPDIEVIKSDLDILSGRFSELSGTTDLQLRTLKNGRKSVTSPVDSTISQNIISDIEWIKRSVQTLDENKTSQSEIEHLQQFTDGIADQVEKIMKFLNAAALPSGEFSLYRNQHKTAVQRDRNSLGGGSRPSSGSSPRTVVSARSSIQVEQQQIIKRTSLGVTSVGAYNPAGSHPTGSHPTGSLKRPSTAGPGNGFHNVGGKELLPQRPQSADVTNPKYKIPNSSFDQQQTLDRYDPLAPRSYITDNDGSSTAEIIQLQQLPAGIRMGRPSRLTTLDGVVTNASVTPRVNLSHYHNGNKQMQHPAITQQPD